MLGGFEKLDTRTRNYQFDLEHDIPWSRADEPGLFFTRAYLKKLGFDLDAVAAEPGAEDLLQALLAVCTCRVFAHLETDVIYFLQDEHEQVPITRSAMLLTAEEIKHTVLFERFATILTDRTPRLTSLLAPHYEPPRSFERLKADREKLGSTEVLHFLFWLNTVFFEELTKHVWRELSPGAAKIHPTWLEMHRCHYREEAQHVLTDHAYLKRSPLSADERYRWSKVFALNLHGSFRELLALDAVEGAMRDAFPNLTLFPDPLRFEHLGLFEDLLTSPSFALTRDAAPYLQRYRENWESGRRQGTNVTEPA
jgi:hypothetical protein